MGKDDTQSLIEVARTAATAAGALLAGVHRLEIAVADPLHTRLRDVLAALLPVCRALAESFPAVRGQVAGLVYQSVEYRGFHGSSALHVVAQMAELILACRPKPCRRSNSSASPRNSSGPFRAASTAGCATTWTPSCRRSSGSSGRASPTSSIAWSGHGNSPTWSGCSPASRGRRGRWSWRRATARPTPRRSCRTLEVTFPNEKLALVTEGTTTIELRGAGQVWVFRQVVEAAGRVVNWQWLVKEDIRRAADRVSSDGRSATPRMATSPASFQRAGNRIRDSLGKLAYHWHQDGHGARWDPEVS